MKDKSEYTFLDKIIRYCLENKLIVFMLVAGLIFWGILVMPFDINFLNIDRNPVPVDAIPDIGENQQIVFTEWMGRSPRDIEDQITYPLAVALQGIPGVKTIRSSSFFGFSSIYIIFKENVDFYWSRSRVLEKLNSAGKILPSGITPILGPDATGLGQIFWYTVEGKGFTLQELRTIQDFYIRYSLQASDGVSEVASIGGFVKEYQIDVNPDRLRYYNISIQKIFMAVKEANIDIGAKTIDVNSVEYVIRSLGFIKNISDVEEVVITEVDNIPVRIKDIAHVSLGPAMRRGVLDKEGAEVVGSVVVARYGENPLKVIKNLKKVIKQISPGLPKKILDNGEISQVKIVPFYDRSILIKETLHTLQAALTDEIFITIIVVLIMILNFRISLLVSFMLPVGVLMTFILMKIVGVDSNIMSLSGIAIAIGTMVDMGIIVTENINKHIAESPKGTRPLDIVFNAASEVGSAILTAILTTIVSFVPIFAMTGAEGKLFQPLAWTKTFALLSSVIIALTILPLLAQLLLIKSKKKFPYPNFISLFMLLVSIFIMIKFNLLVGLLLFLTFGNKVLAPYYSDSVRSFMKKSFIYFIIILAIFTLTTTWRPLGFEKHFIWNLVFICLIFFVVLGGIILFHRSFKKILIHALEHKKQFMAIPVFILLFGLTTWFGFDKMFSFIPKTFSIVKLDNFISSSSIWVFLKHKLPGFQKEFMPNLDEGSFLYMPTTMPHSSISENIDMLQLLDKRLKMIPEVASVVGKLGRVESPLDPAPISMFETIVTYKEKYKVDEKGRRIRVWRDNIETPDDIWDEMIKYATIPGLTSAPKLQPISARIVMLQSGMRAPMGIKIKGPSLEAIEKAGFLLEEKIKLVEGVEPAAVVADRVVGKPYLEIIPDRKKLARYGISIHHFNNIIEIAVGGKNITKTIEGRETYGVRIRYQRERRDSIEALGEIYITVMGKTQIPITQLAKIEYRQGPMVIKSEDTFLTSYVLFDKKKGYGEVDVVENAQAFLKDEIKKGTLKLPDGVNYVFAGNYENQIRSEKTLSIILPIALFVIFMILYIQFKSVPNTMFIFSSIFIALCGGMILLYFYSVSWFMDFSLFGVSMKELFNVRQFHLSVAVWVGFLALFGVASDNGVIVATYLDDIFKRKIPKSIKDIREMVTEGAMRRVLPCLMTTATTVIALIPVITSKGRGSDVMVPMAIPLFGGMMFALITIFIVPVLYSWYHERQFVKAKENLFSRSEVMISGFIKENISDTVYKISESVRNYIQNGFQFIINIINKITRILFMKKEE